MKRLARLLWPLLFAGMVIAVYLLKGHVEEREGTLARTQQSILDERESIEILRAEWSYLNRPERLRRLAATRSDLQPIGADRYASWRRMGQRLAEAAPIELADRGTHPAHADPSR
jgi:hypothetical protein